MAYGQVTPSATASPSEPGAPEAAAKQQAAAPTGTFETNGTTSPQPLGPGEVRLQVADGTRMAYLVNEQLAQVNLPSDAVAVTETVEGLFIFGPDHTILPQRSKLAVDLRTLTSDKQLRDRFIRIRTLETNLYPSRCSSLERPVTCPYRCRRKANLGSN